MPLFFGNLPTDLASSFINTAASLRVAGGGMAARSVVFGLYDAALREVRVRAGRDVSLRSWLAVSKWVDDAAPFPDQRDKLVKGQVELRGRGVDLSNIGCPMLNISGKWDYVVPPSQTEATTALAGSRHKGSVSLDTGHVGMLVGPGAADLWPRVRDWLAPRSVR